MRMRMHVKESESVHVDQLNNTFQVSFRDANIKLLTRTIHDDYITTEKNNNNTELGRVYSVV
jgi:hypothetical protein